MKKLYILFITTFWKQNSYHQHGVLLHTLRVTWEVVKAGHYRFIPAALLHDLGKPGSAHQKDEDVINKEFSFTDHEERSFLMIKDWKFISDYTKQLVRYHYLIRRISKAKAKGLAEYEPLKNTYDNLPEDFKKDLKLFMQCDDRGKGKRKIKR